MDAIAVDWAASQIAGIDITKVPTIVRGFERGYGAASPEEIRIIGQAIDKFQVNDFVPATGNSLFANAFRWPLNTRTFKNLFVERPVPDPQLCTGCGQCIKICPAGAISLPKKAKSVPEYDYGICIRCYCCLEICPEGALGKKPGRLQWMLNIMDR
jgi:ferredoxin